MATSTNDQLATISISSKSKVMAEKIMEAITAMPEFANTDAEIVSDTRRGGYGFRYEAFNFHLQ